MIFRLLFYQQNYWAILKRGFGERGHGLNGFDGFSKFFFFLSNEVKYNQIDSKHRVGFRNDLCVAFQLSMFVCE